MNRQMMRAAALGGLAMGAASATPVLSALNCACCSLVVLGGFLTAYLYFKDAPATATPQWGDAAIVGLLGGLIGAGVTAMLSLPIALLGWGAGTWSTIQQALSDADLPPELKTFFSTFGAGTFAISAILLSFVFNLFVYGLFSTLGSLLGAAVMHRKPVPAPPPMPPMPAPPPPAQPPPAPPTPPAPPPAP
jgi:hypothetical protein